MRSRGCWDAPGAVEEGVAQRGEDGDVVRPGGGDVGTDAAEGLEPAHAPPAPADLGLELGHPDRLFAAVVGPLDVEVDSEIQHLVDPLGHPFGPGPDRHQKELATPERCRAYARLAEEVARSRTVAAEMALFLASGLLGATLPHYFDRNHWWELGAVGAIQKQRHLCRHGPRDLLRQPGVGPAPLGSSQLLLMPVRAWPPPPPRRWGPGAQSGTASQMCQWWLLSILPPPPPASTGGRRRHQGCSRTELPPEQVRPRRRGQLQRSQMVRDLDTRTRATPASAA